MNLSTIKVFVNKIFFINIRNLSSSIKNFSKIIVESSRAKVENVKFLKNDHVFGAVIIIHISMNEVFSKIQSSHRKMIFYWNERNILAICFHYILNVKFSLIFSIYVRSMLILLTDFRDLSF